MEDHDGKNAEKSTFIKGLDLLTLLLEKSGDMSIRELAQGLNSQPSSVHRTLSIFEKNGYLLRNSSNGRFTVGAKLLRLAMLIVEYVDPDGLQHEELAKIVQQTNETCALYLIQYPNGSEVFVADVVNSPHPLHYRIHLGERHALTAGASGLAALSFMPDSVKNDLMDKPLKRYTQDTTMDPDSLRRKLPDICELGYAITYGEHISGAVGIAVPFFDKSESEPLVLGSLCLTIPSERFNERLLNKYVNILREAANSFSISSTTLRKFGHQLTR